MVFLWFSTETLKPSAQKRKLQVRGAEGVLPILPSSGMDLIRLWENFLPSTTAPGKTGIETFEIPIEIQKNKQTHFWLNEGPQQSPSSLLSPQ